MNDPISQADIDHGDFYTTASKKWIQEIVDVKDRVTRKNAIELVDKLRNYTRSIRVESTNVDPGHYTSVGPTYEHFRVVNAWKLDYFLGCSTKYIMRAGKKRSKSDMSDKDKQIEDLRKAIKYIELKIEVLDEQDNNG